MGLQSNVNLDRDVNIFRVDCLFYGAAVLWDNSN